MITPRNVFSMAADVSANCGNRYGFKLGRQPFGAIAYANVKYDQREGEIRLQRSKVASYRG